MFQGGLGLQSHDFVEHEPQQAVCDSEKTCQPQHGQCALDLEGPEQSCCEVQEDTVDEKRQQKPKRTKGRDVEYWFGQPVDQGIENGKNGYHKWKRVLGFHLDLLVTPRGKSKDAAKHHKSDT